VRWQPLDPNYIGAVTLRAIYTEPFDAPSLPDLSPAGAQNFRWYAIHAHLRPRTKSRRSKPEIPSCNPRSLMDGPLE
jgi:hypothetical protein